MLGIWWIPVGLVFSLSLGMLVRNPFAMTTGIAIAPLFVAYFLLRRLLSMQEPRGSALMTYGSKLWVAANLVPISIHLRGDGLMLAWVAGAKSFLWMVVLVSLMRLGIAISRWLGANRLLGIICSSLAAVLAAALQLAPEGRLVACPRDACLKPLLGHSVPLLGALERERIVVHMPAVVVPPEDSPQ